MLAPSLIMPILLIPSLLNAPDSETSPLAVLTVACVPSCPRKDKFLFKSEIAEVVFNVAPDFNVTSAFEPNALALLITTVPLSIEVFPV